MTDKEMLEYAAKAAGYPIHSDAWACGAGGGTPKLYMGNHGPEWNPPEDDGDTFRLAVTLGLSIEHCYADDESDSSAGLTVSNIDGDISITVEIDDERSRLVTTRDAISRVAAMIGRAMP